MENKSKNPAYAIWRAMNFNNKLSKIKVCDEWLIFENFLEDMGERPLNHKLRIIDKSKGFEKNNCEWVLISHFGDDQKAMNGEIEEEGPSESFNLSPTLVYQIMTDKPKMLLKVPPVGDMNYLYLTLYQARYLRDQLNEALNKPQVSDVDDLVVPLPKKEKENDR